MSVLSLTRRGPQGYFFDSLALHFLLKIGERKVPLAIPPPQPGGYKCWAAQPALRRMLMNMHLVLDFFILISTKVGWEKQNKSLITLFIKHFGFTFNSSCVEVD